MLSSIDHSMDMYMDMDMDMDKDMDTDMDTDMDMDDYLSRALEHPLASRCAAVGARLRDHPSPRGRLISRYAEPKKGEHGAQ